MSYERIPRLRGQVSASGKAVPSPRRARELTLQDHLGNLGVQRLLQAKRTGRRAPDPLEDEADRVAVLAAHGPMRGPASVADRPASSSSAAPVAVPGGLPAEVTAAIAGGGRPLESGARRAMEEQLGAAFDDVQIHTDERAAASARALGTAAYTVGSHVVFGPGEGAPESDRALLAHELVHVVQQRRGGASLQGKSDPDLPMAAPSKWMYGPGESLYGLRPEAMCAGGPCMTDEEIYAPIDSPELTTEQLYAYLREKKVRTYFDALRARLAREQERYSSIPESRQAFIVYRDILGELETAARTAGTDHPYTVDVRGLWDRARYFSWDFDETSWMELCTNCQENPSFSDTGPFSGMQGGEQIRQLFNIVTGSRNPDPTWFEKAMSVVGEILQAGFVLAISLAGGGEVGLLGAGEETALGASTLPDLEGLEEGETLATRPRLIEPFIGPSTRSPIDLITRRPGFDVTAAEASRPPAQTEITALTDAGGRFIPSRFGEEIPDNAMAEAYVRFPLAQAKEKDLITIDFFENRPPMPKTPEQLETMTNLGPHALRWLEPDGRMEILFYDPEVQGEIEALRDLRWTDPSSGTTYRFEVGSPEEVSRSAAAPYSGYRIPVDVDIVTQVVVRKVPAP